MINVGFLLNFPVEYKGGINYIKNLFYAINKYHNHEVKITLFVPKDIPNEYISIFAPLANIVYTPIFQRGTFSWLLSRLSEKYLGFDYLVYRLIRKHKIHCISHSNYVYPFKSIRTINWIPDFQYLHYPNLWPKKQLKDTKKLHNYLIKKSERILLSSYSAYNDYKTVYAKFESKVKVLHFVSQPYQILSESGISDTQVEKYVSDKPYFYLPNQFWAHKNHIVVFKACKILRDKGYKFQLLTSGFMKDYRSNNESVIKLLKYIKENDLEPIINNLSLIPYKDVFNLIISAKALINPSYFEGWSSTVEEAKTVGTLTLLSDIPVHREQDPLGAHYFNPDSEIQLATMMEQVLTGQIVYSRPSIDILNRQLDDKTQEFGQEYVALIKQLVDNN
jgi:glycosyltransferase involved in cell wall biosynthesis